MWVLKKLKDGSTKYLIYEKRSYTVGRKTCDIILEEDSSISRKHCTIYIDKKENCPFSVSTVTGVWIVDEQSKYGTFLNNNNNWVKIESNKNVSLTSGTILKFGLMENIWSIEYKPVIACTSGVQSDLKKEIDYNLKIINGELKNEWTKDCSLVIVNEITLTVKVVLALINGVPIVTSLFVKNLVNAIKNQEPLPDYKNFKPDIKESILDASLISLDIKNNRKELFKGKIFVIPTKRQLETLKPVVLSAGGKIELFSPVGGCEHYKEKNVILIQLPLNSVIPESLKKSFKEVSMFLSNKCGRRVVPESEIAQAVAYSSIEKYCNPESTCFNFKRIIDNPDPGVLLVEETPYSSEQIIPDPCVIPSSSTAEIENENYCSKPGSTTLILGRKRNHSPESDTEYNKRKVANESVARENETVKETTEKDNSSETSCQSKTFTQTTKSQSKNSFITNYFKKQSDTSKCNLASDEGIDSAFWDQEPELTANKRKLPTEIDSNAESCKRKRVSVSSHFDENPSPREVIEVIPADKKLTEVKVLSRKSSAKTKSFDSVNENDLADFIEKDNARDLPKYGVDDLNNTIYSLTLISSAYLNEDGSLIDPPAVPVNVKKFKKQLICPSGGATSENQVEDEFSDGDWIEPHPLDLVYY